MIIRIDSAEKLQGIVNQAENLLVYFYNDDCAPCLSLRPKVEDLISERFPLMDMVYIDAKKYQVLAADFQVFSMPVLIFFFEGKEYLRYSKHVSLTELSESIGRIYDLYHLPR
jgi:thioredoxin 1